MPELPTESDIELANWNWRAVRQFVRERFGISLSRSGGVNYRHRLGFVLKRPQKRLVQADHAKRESFVAEYAARWDEAGRSGAQICFADAARFRADAALRGQWALPGEPALVDSSSPRHGEKASYYSAVCLETGAVEWMELAGNSNSATSAGLPETTAGETRRALERDLGQRSGAPGRGGKGVAPDAGPGPAADEPAGLQSGLQRR